MQPELEIITKEIPAKGKAYIIVRRCPPEGLDAALRRGAAQALSQGGLLSLLTAFNNRQRVTRLLSVTLLSEFHSRHCLAPHR